MNDLSFRGHYNATETVTLLKYGSILFDIQD